MSMNAEPKRLWLEALRSGGYEQGTGSLASMRRGKKLFCCLGVACEVAISNGVRLDKGKPDRGGDYPYEDGCGTQLPSAVQWWLGVDDEDPYLRVPGGSLSCLNDEGSTFAEIADLIEAQL